MTKNPQSVEILPERGVRGKKSKKARRQLDAKEREIFELRRDGFTFQEILDLLRERAEKEFETTGVMPDHYTSMGSLKAAYDRYIARAPERFDLQGRREHLELAIQRAEDNYKRLNVASRAKGIELVDKARLNSEAGKWFDRLSKLRALTEENVTINNFTQNNVIVNDSDLLNKLTTLASEQGALPAPNFDEFKSADTVPPMKEVEDAQIVEGEDVVIDEEFVQEETQSESVDIPVPTQTVQHEPIKTDTLLSDIAFSL